MRFSLVIFYLLSLLTGEIFPAIAQQSPVVYSRTLLVIHPNGNTSSSNQIPSPLQITADLRPPASINDASFFLTSLLKPEDAYLVPLSDNAPREIGRANVYTPVDILVINHYGVITLIFPEIILDNLQNNAALPEDSSAILYLPAGRAAKLGITPQAQVENALFMKSPTVLE